MDINEIKGKNYLVIHYGGSNLFVTPFQIACITIFDARTSEKKTFSREIYGNEESLIEDFLREMEGNNLPVITWNMKDSTYGIEQILNRNKELGNEEIHVNKDLFIDLDRALEKKYGTNYYVDHKKLSNLAKLNKIHLQGYLEGSDEVKEFEARNYRAIEVSCNRKVGIISELYEKNRNNMLKIEENSKKNKNFKPEAFLQPFLNSVLAGENPKLSEEVISLLKIPHNENQWLEKKKEYKLTNEGEWTEFLLDILSASNSLTDKALGIFIGVDDETGLFYNSTLPDEATIRQKIRSVITPKIEYVQQAIEYPEKKTGYIIAIKPNKNVYLINKELKRSSGKIIKKGDIWIREGSGKIEFNKNDLNNLIQIKMELLSTLDINNNKYNTDDQKDEKTFDESDLINIYEFAKSNRKKFSNKKEEKIANFIKFDYSLVESNNYIKWVFYIFCYLVSVSPSLILLLPLFFYPISIINYIFWILFLPFVFIYVLIHIFYNYITPGFNDIIANSLTLDPFLKDIIPFLLLLVSVIIFIPIFIYLYRQNKEIAQIRDEHFFLEAKFFLENYKYISFTDFMIFIGSTINETEHVNYFFNNLEIHPSIIKIHNKKRYLEILKKECSESEVKLLIRDIRRSYERLDNYIEKNRKNS